jgi:outer membrane immunogenic protein
MKMQPELTLVQPGSTLLVGRTIPSQNRDELVLLEPHLISGLAPTRSREAIGPLTEHALVSSNFNWTGFYVGVQVGYARSQSDYSLKLGGEWELFPDEAEDIEDEADHEFDEDGFGLGGCAGYNYEFQNHVVIGLGIAGRKYWNLSNTFETGDFPTGQLGDFDVWSSFKTTGLVTLGPKIGYAVGRVLPYVSGGLAFGELDASQKIFSNQFGGFREGEKASEMRLGWNAAAGVQYAFTNNWSVRVEYSYSDLGTFKYPGKSEPAVSFRDFTTWHMATLTEHAGNFGIVYTFGGTTSASSR